MKKRKDEKKNENEERKRNEKMEKGMKNTEEKETEKWWWKKLEKVNNIMEKNNKKNRKRWKTIKMTESLDKNWGSIKNMKEKEVEEDFFNEGKQKQGENFLKITKTLRKREKEWEDRRMKIKCEK